MRIWARLIALFRDRQDDRDLEEELDAHHALLADDYRRRGLSDADADRAARVALGGATQLREAHRDVRSMPVIESLARDLRYAVTRMPPAASVHHDGGPHAGHRYRGQRGEISLRR